MRKAVAIHPTKPALPTIDRDPALCFMHLSAALAALEDLTKLEGICESEEQLNLVHRSDLSSLFAVLHDYADAARRALPEDL